MFNTTFTGQSFLGAPYMNSPLGEDVAPDSDPLIRFDAFDCTTFVETVLADGDVKKLNALATQCWYKNKPKWDAAAKSTGQLKGYSSAIILANAYRRINYTT